MNTSCPYTVCPAEAGGDCLCTLDRLSAQATCSAAGAEAQLLRLAKAHGYERVWHDPRDETRWFAERKHPEKDGMIQAIPMDWLLQPPNDVFSGASRRSQK